MYVCMYVNFNEWRSVNILVRLVCMYVCIYICMYDFMNE